MGRQTNVAYPDQTQTFTVYDDLGRVKFSVDARGVTSAPGYDVAGRRVSMTNALGTVVQTVLGYGYDENGNQVYFTNAASIVTTNFYDALNRLTNVCFPDGTKTFTVYDAAGRRIAEANQDGIITLFGYDGSGKLVAVTNAFGTTEQMVTRYEYDEAGNQTAQIDALSRTNRFDYDLLGRRISHTMPDGTNVERFAYDPLGNLICHTNFNGVVITNQYDVMNRLTNRSSIGGYQVTFAYDSLGNRTNMTDPSGTTIYSYDNRNRLQLKTNAWSAGPTASLNYRYDANGNVTNIRSSTTGGVNLQYGYDPLNRITNVVASGTATASYGFDGVGSLQSVHYANGVTNLYQYDALNRLTNSVWRSNQLTLASFYYQLGKTGNRTNLTETLLTAVTNRVYTWTYDSLYRLTTETISGIGSTSYGLDKVGNRTNRTAGLDGLSAQSFSYGPNDWLTTNSYDNNGNTLWSTNGATATGPYYYDVENRLTNFNNTVFLDYNGDGIRVKKTVASTTMCFLVDDRNPTSYAQVLEELTPAGDLIRAYAYGLALVSQREAGGTVYYFLPDGHGSIRLLIDGSGTVANAFTYDAYGTPIASNASAQTVYLYCAEQFDPDLGFYYLRARYLNPNTGRFWTMDTLEGNSQDPVSLHKYLYCQDNPPNYVDPLGTWSSKPIAPIHQMAIKACLKGLLSDSDLGILCDMQVEVDAKQNQDAAHSYMHAMSDGAHGQTPDKAKQMANNRVRTLLTSARNYEAHADHKNAMRELGRAMHTLQDSTSPAHHGFKPWFDYWGEGANPHEWAHAAQESVYPGLGSWLEVATLQAYNYFKGTKPLPTDFFDRLGADSVGDEFFHHFHIPYDSLSGFSVGDLTGFSL